MRQGSVGRRLLYAVFGALGLSACLAPGASAGLLIGGAQGCTEQRLSQPFTRWLDFMSYTPVQDNGLERKGDGWTLGGARTVSGNEPWAVGGASDSRSLLIPEGSRATTPAICVGINEPTLRFFARGPSGASAALAVEVLYEDAFGNVRDEQIGIDLGGSWHPTAVMPISVNLLPIFPGERTPVAFRFTARGGDFQIDDVYVDPWCQR